MKIEFTIPLSKNMIVSEANRGGEHWTKKAKRHQAQHLLINSYMNRAEDGLKEKRWVDFLPLQITMTRIAPRKLDDDDNLRMSMKYFKDAIADKIIPGLPMGRADGDIRLKWIYSQEKGIPKEYAIRVQISQISSLCYS